MTLQNLFKDNINEYKAIWYDQANTDYTDLTIYSEEQKNKNEQQINEIIDNIIKKFSVIPNDINKRKTWAKELNSYIEHCLSDLELDNSHVIKYFFDMGIMQITKKFVSTALLDDKLPIADIGQAIRNAWIMNILQIMLNVKVQYSNAVFGYSMLYPYSDNLLDSDISQADKYLFSTRFQKRIHGEQIKPTSESEKTIYHMIELIEQDFSREKYSEVFDSLMLIHESQTDSLTQQTTSCPFEKDILGISFNKGGSSVLADGYLVKGDLNEDEVKFTLGFGIILQICDDMQDIQSDIDSSSATILSLSAKGHKLDILTNKLFRLIEYVLSIDINKLHFNNADKVVPFMKQCCNCIVLDGIMTHKKYYSKEYIKGIEKYLPVGTKFLDDIKRKTPRKFNRVFKSYSSDELRQIIKLICEC